MSYLYWMILSILATAVGLLISMRSGKISDNNNQLLRTVASPVRTDGKVVRIIGIAVVVLGLLSTLLFALLLVVGK